MSASNGKSSIQTVAAILSHPLREQALRLVLEAEYSPSEVAHIIDQPLGVVSYHMRTLAKLHAIALTRRVPRRGALEHYYRATDLGRVAVDVADKIASLPAAR